MSGPTLREQLGTIQLIFENCAVADWVSRNYDMPFSEAVPHIIARLGTPVQAMVTLRQCSKGNVRLRGPIIQACLGLAYDFPDAAFKALKECARQSEEYPSGLSPDEVDRMIQTVRNGPDGEIKVRELEVEQSGTKFSADLPSTTKYALVVGGEVKDIREFATIPEGVFRDHDWRLIEDNRVGVDLTDLVYTDDFTLEVLSDRVIKTHQFLPKAKIT